jgi:DNA-directed RNA polymerase subunit M/transcription elongation factor TFIIS
MDKESIHFCGQCYNMTFIHLDEDDKLIHACKICGEIEEFKEGNHCIYSSNFKNFDVSLIINENKYITHDKTLPSIQNNTNMKCPNNDCQTNTEKISTSFKYIKYNEDDMKYIYICETCGQKWNN